MSPPLSLAWDPAVFADAARGTHRAIMNDRQRDPRYKAEGGQDVFVDRVLFREQRGTFVDLGCNDGIHGSNTYFLAQVRGWRGVCVEADPTNFAAVEPNSGRTDAKHVAVVEHLDGTGTVELRTNGKSGIDGHRNGLASLARGKGKGKGIWGHIVRVKATTPALLLAETFAINSTIDFVSMDIEGGELAVLRAWPWELYCVNAFSLENWRIPRDLRPVYASLVEPHGYAFARRLAQDDLFVRRVRCPPSSVRTAPPSVEAPPLSPSALVHVASAWQHTGCPRSHARSATTAQTCVRTNTRVATGAVRCCGERRRCHSVCYAHQRPYSRSRWELPPRVVPDALAANFSGAAAECRAHGLRLCRRAELAAEDCCKSGCGLDTKMVWTGDACGNET